MLSLDKSLINHGDRLIVGVSGGVDSVVLLHLLNAIKSSMDLSLVVAHMNYGTRGESVDDERFTEGLARSMGLPFASRRFSADDPGDNFQQQAREARYHFFCELADRHDADAVCVAHQADDQAETILIRLMRGSDFEGHAGIRKMTKIFNHTVIRPMLDIPKEDILAYADEHDIAFRVDRSNRGDDYLRNRIRHHVLPFFKNENPSFLKQAGQFSDLLREAATALHAQRDAFMENHVDHNRFKRNIFMELPEIIQRFVLQKIVRSHTGDTYDLSHEKTSEAMSMIAGATPHLHFQIADDVYLHRSYDDIWVDDRIKKTASYRYVMEKPGECRLSDGQTVILSENRGEERGKSYELWYNDFDSVFPVTIRNRENGDRIEYPFGTKKIKDVFIDKKVPMDVRNRIPIVLDKTGRILWIPGIYAKRTQGNKSLRFTYQERNH
jgi:tRNA(Ile)-lysidine synthase